MTRPASGGAGWSSPQIIMAAIGFVSMVGGSYLAIQRDDSKQVQKDLRDIDRQLAVLETRVLYIVAENARCERDQRERNE